MRKMKPVDRTAGENKAKPWIARMRPVSADPLPWRPPPSHLR